MSPRHHNNKHEHEDDQESEGWHDVEDDARAEGDGGGVDLREDQGAEEALQAPQASGQGHDGACLVRGN